MVTKFMRFGFCLICSVFAMNIAFAQTTFSFAGLSWGDSVQQVDTKLKAAGFSGCAFQEKLLCKAAQTCRCRVQGPAVQEGWAELTNDKLHRVFVTVHDWSDTVDVLTKKYGPPKILRPPARGLGKFDLDNGVEVERIWIAPTSETLELLPSHRWLTYTSGERNRGAASKDKANKSLF